MKPTKHDRATATLEQAAIRYTSALLLCSTSFDDPGDAAARARLGLHRAARKLVRVEMLARLRGRP